MTDHALLSSLFPIFMGVDGALYFWVFVGVRGVWELGM